MSGFHPVLGLLAVAVCISFAEGASLSSVQKGDISISQLLQTNPQKSALSARDDGRLRSTFYNKNHHISRRDRDNQDRDVVGERYAERVQDDRFAKLTDLKTDGYDTGLPKAEARESGSEALGRESQEGESVLSAEETSKSEEESSESSPESQQEPHKPGNVSQEMGLSNSQSEENCEDDGVNDTPVSAPTTPKLPPSKPSKPSLENEDCEQDDETSSTNTNEGNDSQSSSTQSAVSESIPPTEPTDEEPATTDDDCEGSEPPEDSGSNSSQDGGATEQPDEPEDVPTTSKTRPPKKPHEDDSSLSFHASDSSGVEFSNSHSEESNGKSTELTD